MRLGILKSTCLLALLAVCEIDPVRAADEKLERYEFLQIEMGVPFRIVLYAPDEEVANKAARAAYARIKQLNAVMSDYDPDSELMRLCRSSGPGKPVKVSPELATVLSHSLRLSQQTDGAFDVTVGPLVRLWRIARRRKKLPAPTELKAARKQVGYRRIKLVRKAGTVELLTEGMRLDLGGVAKGYAGDEALRQLNKLGVTRALIDGSGDIVLGDPPPGRNGWRVEIAATNRRPRPAGAAEKQADDSPKPIHISLANAAVATSGDAFQYVEIDGRRYSHIIDPKTGLGLMHSSSVTVIAKNGVTADSLASAVSVLGPRRGLKLIESGDGVAALIVQLNRGGRRVSRSKLFDSFVIQKEEMTRCGSSMVR